MNGSPPPRFERQLESFIGGIEPRDGRNPSAARAAISQAISLKRAADALERIAELLESVTTDENDMYSKRIRTGQ